MAIGFAVFATAGPTHADGLTLPAALSEMETSPQIDQARSASEELSWKRVESYGGFLPELNANGEYLFGKKYAFFDFAFPGTNDVTSIPQIIPNSFFAINLQWPIFDGLANFDRLRAAKNFESAGKKQFDWIRFQSQRQVALFFYRALAAQSLQQVAQQNVKTLEDHLGDANLLRKTGVSTKYDVLRVEVQTSEARSDLLNAQDLVTETRLRLGELLGKESESRELVGEMPVLKADMIRGLNTSEVHRADLAAMEDRTKGYDELSTAAAKFWVPKVGLFGQFQTYNNRNDAFVDTDAYRNAYMYGVSLTWNIFDGLQSYAKDRQAVEQKNQNEKSLVVSQLKAKNDLSVFRKRYLYNCSVYQSRIDDVGKAEESVRLAREGRRVGVRTNSDLLDAELELFRARAGVINAQVGAVEALINLELSTGQKVLAW